MPRFKARARAVEMLGRQQIAGIPTAISELFKNAHDAYAKRVEVDFLRKERLFILRDDGMGMSRQDFEERWLTLGTESKLGLAFGIRPPEPDPRQPTRPILGEKGIGRLAIAAIGPQVLVLTRPKLGPSQETVAAFMNWGLFALPGVDLDEIEIPILTLSDGGLPDGADVDKLVSATAANLDRLAARTDPEAVDRLRAELAGFTIDPRKLEDELDGLSLDGSGHGTHFFIAPTDESLLASIREPTVGDAASPLSKMLIGFANTMTPGHPPPRIVTAFRDHKNNELVDDLIEEREFFTPDEFRKADHHVEGRFDEYGQFNGTVTVYGEPTAGHVVPWANAAGRMTDCGPFLLDLAVVQGTARESAVPPDEWRELVRKMDRIGGLYIYRDGIRVLPYGNNDYDFLDIERNRTKSASYYYFSYRRMFGVVEISAAENGNLTEKAGREGFRENRAYRQFRDILMNFFVQLAADFFRDESVSERYRVRRTELDRVERARRERERLVSVRRQALRQELETMFASAQNGTPRREVGEVLVVLENDLAGASVDTPDAAATDILKAESRATRALRELQERYRVVPPRGIGFSKTLRQDIEAWRHEYELLVDTSFGPARQRIEELVASSTTATNAAIDRRVRFDRGLDELGDQTRKGTRADSAAAREAATNAAKRVAELARASVAEVEQTLRDVVSRAARLDLTGLSDEEFVRQRTALEAEIQAVADEERRVLGSVAERLDEMTWSRDETGQILAAGDATASLEEEVLSLREQTEADLELAQLGMAVQVINHEFEATIRSVRQSLRELRAWADANGDLQDLYGRMRASFEHLDGYLTLFTPLQRRLYRKVVRITGAQIATFLGELFEGRLRRHRVELQSTAAFRRHSFTGYPSTFYPVFVNLVDNAIFWVGQRGDPRWIRLDWEGGVMSVADSGPGVATRDRDAVFEFGFTRKPAGRGMGLSIAREVLARDGYELTLADAADQSGAVFNIRPQKGDVRGERDPG
jgi:signal transduction histidine kinase